MKPDIDPETKRSVSITNRWNDEELRDLKELKSTLGLKDDGKAIKYGVKISRNVLQNVFGNELIVLVSRKPKAYHKEIQKLLDQKRQ